MRFTKLDIVASLILGEISAFLLWPFLRNVGLDVFLSGFLKTRISLPLLAIAVPFLALAAVYAFFILSKIKPIFFQMGKFLAVGATNTFIDWGVFNVLVFITGVALGRLPAMFKIASFVAATSNSYFWNKFWTFEAKKDKTKTEALKFYLISGIGAAGNIGIFAFVSNVISIPEGISEIVWANIGVVMGTMFSLVWNFLGYKYLVFKSDIKIKNIN